MEGWWDSIARPKPMMMAEIIPLNHVETIGAFPIH
jgi:hypothetical protein